MNASMISTGTAARFCAKKPAWIKAVLIFWILTSSQTSLYAADLTIDVNAASFIRTIPETMYGANLMAWDGVQDGTNSSFTNLMNASGRKYLRWCGGSWGDAYLWSDMEGPLGANSWIVSYSETLNLLGQLGGTIQPIVNFPGYWYGVDHSEAEAIAAAVAWVQDQQGRTPSAQHWEIGNEVFGPWEEEWSDSMSGTYYGDHFANFYIAMKAVNPDINIGAVAQEYDTPDWWNPGLWTRDMLNAANAKGVVPDFLIIHAYPGSNQGATYNPTFLGHDVDEIENFTNSLNYIISDTVGEEYVGRIKYWMTEWGAGGIDNSYERWRLYVSALFKSQYIMEMAKNGWEGSNCWNQEEYYGNYYPYPDWFVYPFLINKFGRDMVDASSTNSLVRAYASTDDAGNLTVFIVNNSPDTNLTAQVNIAGITAKSGGQYWLIEPGGLTDTGQTSPVQNLRDVKINGTGHPDPLTVNSISPASITSSNTFDVALPMSCILLLKVPVSPLDNSPYGGTAWPVAGTIEAEDYDLGDEEVSWHDTTTGNGSDIYRSDDVDIEECNEGGYNVTGIKEGEWLEYSINVESTGIYKIEARVASADANGVFHFELDGNDVTGAVSFAATGDAQTYTTVDANNCFILKGAHILRLSMDSNDWNINWIKLTKLGGGTGSILREWWGGTKAGAEVNKLTTDRRYPSRPTAMELITAMETEPNFTNYYGQRIRGYLNPIFTGDYTFSIAADDSGQLWLSSDDNPANASLIANAPGSEESLPVSLIAGQKYYIEVLHKEDSNSDNLAVSWEGPNTIRQVIDGSYLSPYLAIQKCTIRAGRTQGMDYITCSGNFPLAAGSIDGAESVTVKIYSANDDYLVYEQTIDRTSFMKSRSTYKYTHRVLSGQPGGITSMCFNMGTHKFYFKTKNVNLTGLACPLYVIIEIRDYIGTGFAGESIVNGRRSIPIRLMSGYADTLAVTRISSYDYATPSDRLYLKGTFTVIDDSNMTQGLEINWGLQTFTIPGDRFLPVGSSRLTTTYLPGDGSYIYADFNFYSCAFKITIKQTTITPLSGTTDFGLVFGEYDKTVVVSP